MIRESSLALGGFANFRDPAPYMYRSHAVRPALCKTGIAASRKIMLAHAVAAMASVVIDGKITYGAQWLCTRWGGSVDAVILPADTTNLMCKTCAHRIAGDGPGVYRIFNAAGDLIYTGSSVFVSDRIMRHRLGSPWKDQIADVKVTRYPTLAQARTAEIRAIHDERPLLNVLHLPGRTA